MCQVAIQYIAYFFQKKFVKIIYYLEHPKLKGVEFFLSVSYYDYTFASSADADRNL